MRRSQIHNYVKPVSFLVQKYRNKIQKIGKFAHIILSKANPTLGKIFRKLKV